MTTYKNNRDKWVVDIDDFFHADGRKEPRIRKTSPVQTERAANQLERQIRQKLLDGTYGKYAKVADDAPTLSEFQHRYLLWYRSERRKETGENNNVSLLRNPLVELFGDRKMDSFDANDELTLKAHYANHSASRYNQAAATINGCIKLFYRLKKLTGAFRFGRLKVDPATKPFYEFDRYERLLAAAKRIGVISELVIMLGGDAGLRRSEMWGLTPARVRMMEGKLIIERAETIVGKKRYMRTTKGREIRTIEMTPGLHDAFSRYFVKYGQRERIIATSDGSEFNQGSFERFMKAIQKAAGLEETGETHILRHTFCSHLAILGVPVTVIQKLAGHQRLTTTLGYMHLAPGDTAAGMAKLSSRRLLGSGNATATD